MGKLLANSVDTTKSLEQKIYETGKELFRRVKSSKASFFDRSFWSSKLMDLAMKDPDLKVELFRFVDVLPTLITDDQLIKHIQEYFGNVKGEHADLLKFATQLSGSGFLGKIAAAVAVKTGVTQMARSFIAGENVKEVFQKVTDLRKNNMAFTVDILGEAVLSEKESDYYQKLYIELVSGLSKESIKWNKIDLLDIAPYGELPMVNVSVKLSSLYSQTDPIDFKNSVNKLKEKLKPILTEAVKNNTFIYLDMESYFYKDLTLTVFKEILEEEEFKLWKHAGIVIQAYLKDSEADLKDLIGWVKNRGTPITVRLVKGAYWDYETIISKQKHWRCPVFENKNDTDVNYEKLTSLLLDNYPHIYTAIGSHNIRSLSNAKAYADFLNLPKGAVEYQFLYGMADPIKEAFVSLGERVRVYIPYGELIPGMAYLVRRLLENTANESFLKQGFQEGISEDDLLKNPLDFISLNKEFRTPDLGSVDFVNSPDTDFTVLANRELMENAIKKARKDLSTKYPLIINGKKIETSDWADSINPSYPDEIVGKFALATTKHADDAVKAAKDAFSVWQDTDIEQKVKILKKAAQIMEEKRFELGAVMVLEEGKPIREADGDVSEAIDFLNYYSLEAKKLFSCEKLISPSGEDNFSFYQPKGVAVVISPWNFPLAILTGMSSAALACGNTVILKPAKQASVIAAKYVEILHEAGLPPGVCNYLPGDGKTIGNYLVSHKDVNLIAFTGSMEVGLHINRLASEVSPGQDFVKKVICEMGGKNAIILDSDADLDEAVKGVIYSTFGYAGQKCSACSRVIVVKEIYEYFLVRLIEAAKSITLGPSEDPASYLGPVIDKSAFESILKYIEIGKTEGKLIAGGGKLNNSGYFIKPTIFSDIKVDSRIAQEEIFGPVLAVIKADNFEQAIQYANGVRFALTGGLFSRSPQNIEIAKNKFKVGNLYINRSCTGAKVGRQPFGGFKMSGIGSKAGGKDYLLQFVEPRVVTENTMRRGFAPE